MYKLQCIDKKNIVQYYLNDILYVNLQEPKLIRSVLTEWRNFCEKPPKGFEKYFKPGTKEATKDAKGKETSEVNKGKESKTEPKQDTQTPKPPPSLSQPPGSSKPYDQWSFGLFGGTGNRYENKYIIILTLKIVCCRSSGGKPFGDNDKDKWYIFGAAGAIAFLATLAFWEMGYKEIGWKEFVHTLVYTSFTN